VVCLDDTKTRIDYNTLGVLRWERLGELWAEDQFGCWDGRDAALRRLKGILLGSRSRPDRYSWSRLVHAYELKWSALRRDWLVRRAPDSKPHLSRAVGRALGKSAKTSRWVYSPFQQSATAVAQNIADLIGGEAFFMLGSGQSLIATGSGIAFRVSGSKKCNKIVITLSAPDTYTVQFWSVSNTAVHKTQEVTGVYAEALLQTVERHTGLSTRL